MEQNTNTPTAAELEQEQIALQAAKEDEVRASVIDEFGFDPDVDADRIAKAVAKEMDSRKKLSEAIGQKIKYREAAKTPQAKSEVNDPDEVVSLVDKKVKESLEQRDLDALGYSDELKKEIKRVSDIQGVSISQAVKDPYIASKVEAYEASRRSEEASASRTHKSGGKVEYSMDNLPNIVKDIDLSTEEGRKKWEEVKEEMKKQNPYIPSI